MRAHADGVGGSGVRALVCKHSATRFDLLSCNARKPRIESKMSRFSLFKHTRVWLLWL